jgi:hypothetical protein
VLQSKRSAASATGSTRSFAPGVLHHLPDPELGLKALRGVLEPDGAMHVMVYAAYGRGGIYMVQDYCRLLGIGPTEGSCAISA